MRTWVIALAVLAALACIVLGSMYYVAGTPRYSLYLVQKAVKDGDRETFYRHFDVQKVVSNSVRRAVGGIPAGPQVVSQKATDVLIPASDSLIRERIDERFDDPGSASALYMTVQDVRYQNNAAFVTIGDSTNGTTTTLTLERMPNRQWTIVDIDLATINVQYSLNEARERAEELLSPQLPDVTRPNLQGLPRP